MSVCSRKILMAALMCAAAAALPVHASSIQFDRPGADAALVSDPGAAGGRALAVNVEPQRGVAPLTFQWRDAAPGLYRVALPMRLLAPTKDAFDKIQLKIELKGTQNDTNAVWLSRAIAPAQFDGKSGAWTTLYWPALLTSTPRSNSLTVSWVSTANRPAAKNTPRPPAGANAPLPAGGLDYPALLVGDLAIEPVATVFAVEKVWPEYIHVYPGGTNPIAVTIRNFTIGAAAVTVRLEIKTGLDETSLVGEEQLKVPASGAASVKFPWTAGVREFGHAAVATIFTGGKPAHSNVEYFTVSAPIWKTALQGDGFISWYGRENTIATHVAENRRAYINVEEAFSWQPSSWTDLNPATDDWYSGQGNGHNSLKALREWMARSHTNGIKMITYSWPTVSGKAGFDWARLHPELLCRDDVGIAPKTDLGDLAVFDVTHDRPELKAYQSGVWQYNLMNLGLLRAIHHHAMEVVRSSRNFGWDGIRFDMPPLWGAIGTEDVQKEFDMLGVRETMKEIVPEYYDTTNAVWSGEAISQRNIRYFRHVFTRELGPNFAMSYNGGGLQPMTEAQTNSFRWESVGGGQIMNEAIRNCRAMSNYLDVAAWHVEGVRALGGYSCLFRAASQAPLAGIYSAIFTFALGSHPYLDYGWLRPLPGAYTQFMTRYGEYCWDLAFAPVAPDKAGVSVESETPLLWERFLRQRQTGDGLQTVIHLIAKPEWDPARATAQTQLEWTRPVKVRKKCRSPPAVWLLTAEPETTATSLQVDARGNTYSVEVPSVHFWSFLVWSEK